MNFLYTYTILFYLMIWLFYKLNIYNIYSILIINKILYQLWAYYNKTFTTKASWILFLGKKLLYKLQIKIYKIL